MKRVFAAALLAFALLAVPSTATAAPAPACRTAIRNADRGFEQLAAFIRAVSTEIDHLHQADLGASPHDGIRAAIRVLGDAAGRVSSKTFVRYRAAAKRCLAH